MSQSNDAIEISNKILERIKRLHGEGKIKLYLRVMTRTEKNKEGEQVDLKTTKTEDGRSFLRVLISTSKPNQDYKEIEDLSGLKLQIKTETGYLGVRYFTYYDTGSNEIPNSVTGNDLEDLLAAKDDNDFIKILSKMSKDFILVSDEEINKDEKNDIDSSCCSIIGSFIYNICRCCKAKPKHPGNVNKSLTENSDLDINENLIPEDI